jgi:chaperonin GroES
MKKSFDPCHDFVLVRRQDPEKKTPGGLYVPETAQARTLEGEVLAVGPGRLTGEPLVTENADEHLRRPMSVKPGDVVLFEFFASTRKVRLNTDPSARDDEFLVLKDEDILGIVTPVAE